MQTAWKSAVVELNDASGNEAYLTRASIFTTEPGGKTAAVTNEHPVRTKEFKDATPLTKTSTNSHLCIQSGSKNQLRIDFVCFQVTCS